MELLRPFHQFPRGLHGQRAVELAQLLFEAFPRAAGTGAVPVA